MTGSKIDGIARAAVAALGQALERTGTTWQEMARLAGIGDVVWQHKRGVATPSTATLDAYAEGLGLRWRVMVVPRDAGDVAVAAPPTRTALAAMRTAVAAGPLHRILQGEAPQCPVCGSARVGVHLTGEAGGPLAGGCMDCGTAL